MPRARTATPPALAMQNAQARVVEYDRRDRELDRQIRDFYRPLLFGFRDQLTQHFHRYYDGNVDPTTLQPAWDLAEARRQDSYTELVLSFAAMVDAAEETLQDDLDEALADGYEEAYYLTLWNLQTVGVDTLDAPEPPNSSARKAALIAAGIGGLSYLDRLHLWGEDAKRRQQMLLRTAIAGEYSLPETLDRLTLLEDGFTKRVAGLGSNELYRSFLAGADQAFSLYRDEIVGEIWVTREDALVCPICYAKRNRLTDEQPIRDSHPGCRCQKVPLPRSYEARPVEYLAFLQQIGRR